ncbi:DUF1294 domain-containing protein [Paenibacillus radicis (ex Gao et al. 2016)]|uniref:DUF1294 domain-containing protein n=1 Tax=Paenibacillus radicis (ex Gao et al. 2016) TaxID=1737354 RepID=A0A917HIB5_9BACL|nr:DUF1294 domain-containing protein [Paenibacillus radicis (ex Gao et al. 2016)]GGG79857.1 hypothetical protein GCM10010918_41230 [Paenibacillus radicis (ex Gao et al. 2016)]
MSIPVEWLWNYLIVVNVVAFALMGADKHAARNKKRRVPEKRLFGFAAIGGAAGAWIGMQVFRHKTKHRSFVVGIPLLILWNLVAVYVVLRLLGQDFSAISF